MSIENLIQIFQNEFPELKEKFTPATKFRELKNWDSLTAMSILTTIEEQFGTNLPEKDFKAMHTIEEVYLFLSK
jgi:acyl carrier protein